MLTDSDTKPESDINIASYHVGIIIPPPRRKHTNKNDNLGIKLTMGTLARRSSLRRNSSSRHANFAAGDIVSRRPLVEVFPHDHESCDVVDNDRCRCVVARVGKARCAITRQRCVTTSIIASGS